MLRVTLLKGDCGNTQMAGYLDVAWRLTSHLVAEALWVLMHYNEIGCYHILTVKVMQRDERINYEVAAPYVRCWTSTRQSYVPIVYILSRCSTKSTP